MLKVSSEFKSYIERPNAFIFRFKKINNQFIHTFCEGQMLNKFGLIPEMVVYKTLYDFMPSETARKKEQFYEQAWQGGNINYEGALNGIYYLAVLIPIIEDGLVVEVMATAFDITREKHNEQMIHKAEKLAMIGQLAAGVAHEIRNPLTTIKGFTQILKESVTDEYLRNYIEIMLGELSRIQRVVNEFMLLSNPTETFIMENTNMPILISNVIKFLKPEAYLNNVHIITDFKSDIRAECDANQMKQVLFNLLQNAIEASSSRKKKIVISLEDISDDTFTITVKDYGKGIPQERQKYLFEPFYTTKEKGTGLGLMVCRQIVDIHQGKIEVESHENIGTVVKISLPKKQQKSS